MSLNRRKFLQGCCAGIVAMNGARLGNLVFAGDYAQQQDIIVQVFLRGGMDAMSFLVPHGDDNYHVARARLALGTQQVIDLNGLLGLHPACNRLKELVDAGHAALIPAAGSPHPTRSHFDAQDFMERGKPGDAFYKGGGWLGRHVKKYPSTDVFQAISRGSSLSVSLEGAPNALAIDGAEGYTIQGDWDQRDDLRRALRSMYGADLELGQVAYNTLQATDIVEYADPGDYTPPEGIVYPNNSIGNALASLAQMIRLDLGMMAATVDMGGWDTHESQADGGNSATGYFANQIGALSNALHAFWSDLAPWHGRLTVVVMSEFGRRLKENNNRGTDHGHAGAMVVLSSNLVRGGLWGTWPGLSSDELFEGVDLDVTTDYRSVLGEVLLARTLTRKLDDVFPDFNFNSPLGFFGVRNGVNPDTARGFMELYR